MYEAPKCEVCEERAAVMVCSVPGIPYSAGYCRECLEADAHPYHLVVSNTACVGGRDKAAPWWLDVVDHSLAWLKKSPEEFDGDVAAVMKRLEEYDPGNYAPKEDGL